MSKINNGGSAFPLATSCGSNESVNGMTLRDYFAAKAMPLAMEDYRLCIGFTTQDIDWKTRGGLSVVAWRAYQLADAMLSAREER